MQVVAIVVSLAVAAVGIALFVRAIRTIIGVMKVGQPASRSDNPTGRTVTMLKESLGHTRMLQWHWVGIGHWFVFVGFGLLFFTLLTAFGQLFDAHFALPLIGHFFLWEWVSELFTVVMVVAIVAFIVYRATRPTERVRGAKGRFWGSTMWQGYFVEGVILGVGLCIVTLRGLEYALLTHGGEHADNASALHFPTTFWLGEALSGLSEDTLANLIYLVAMIKIVISFAWMITISLNPTMGVAWHRFLAFFNIWFKRESSGRTALGAMKPLTSDGKAITLDDIDDLDEDSKLGVGAIEDFSWKGILDFSSCTECGRCQSQCPAWNTEKPLSPKLLITALRDHAHAKAPYLQASSDDARAALLEGNDTLTKEVERPLVGDTGDDWFYMPDSGVAVIDPEVLWNCTSCGACVQQCPVDIEHVDHIMDMRRHAVLVESNFPAELNGLFKGLENKGNPWNMSPNARMDWAKGLDFEVKVVGESIESLDEVDWLFWVGCAGAYEDRAKKTTRAVAELLDIAGVSFGVLGNGETCTGDPARRAGNEFVFQGLAQQNVEVLKEAKVKKVVSTCAHCFNTLKNEYSDFGIELEVVHHTQLLNRLVREGKLTPVSDGAGAQKRSITYHDPCYIGRHNGVYSPPRELLQILPGAEFVEMERNSERSFCCGAGGARMWMEENTGERINVNRTNEAVGTGADQIAVGCPFCRVMLSDGLTAAQAKGEAREEVEVLDVAQMLLASVKGEQATKLAPGHSAAAAPSAKAAAPAGDKDEATKAEPEAGDDTITDDTVVATEDAGPLAKASGGSSLFDDPQPEAEAPTEKNAEQPAEKPAEKPVERSAEKAGGSLFDLGGDEAEAAPVTRTESKAETTDAEAKPTADLASGGGSLFDIGGDEPEPNTAAKTDPKPATQPAPTEPEAKAETKAETKPVADLGSGGGSLFDIASPEPSAPAPAKAGPAPAAKGETAPAPASPGTTAEPTTEIPESGSLFDIEPAEAAPVRPEPEAKPEPEPEPAAEAEPTAEAEPAKATTKPASTGASSEPATEIPESGSLFDIQAPEPAPAAKADPEPEAAPEPEPTDGADEPEPAAETSQPQENLSPGAALTAAATSLASDTEPEPEATSEPEAEPQPQAEPEPEEPATDEAHEPEEKAEEKPKPAASGEAHQPKTDVDISDSGSLFDL
jgi:Fe-S oxidoreductase